MRVIGELFKKYALIPLIFICGLGITIFFSSNPAQSFFGSYDRQAGYLSYIFYFLWFLLVAYNIGTIDNRISRLDTRDTLEQKIKRLISVAVLSSFFVSLYGILQILGLDFLVWPEDPFLTRRTISTFGQPNFLASWLLMLIPLSVYLVYKNKKNIIKFFYVLVLLSQLACLFFTSSRGGLIAFALSFILLIIYLVFFIKLKKPYKLLAGLGMLALIGIGLLAVNFIVPGRLGTLFDFQSGSMAARVNFYAAASDSIIKKPIFGYGLENSADVFIKYYLPEWGILGDIGASTDKAHNLVLDILLASGFFGLLLFTALYYSFFRLAHKNIQDKKMGGLSLALGLGAAAYLFSLLFSFTIIAGEIFFWLFLSLLSVINFKATNKVSDSSDNNKIFDGSVSSKIIVSIVLLLIMMSGIYYEFRLITADHYFNRLYYALGERQYFTSFVLADYAKKAEANPINQEHYDQFLGDKLSDFYPDIAEVSAKRTAYKRLQDLDNKLRPNSSENIFVKAKINSALGNYQISEDYFYQVISASPYWPKTYIELARLFTRERRSHEAIINYQMALSNLPEFSDPRLNEQHKIILNVYRKIIFREMGDIYFSDENYAEAEVAYQSAYKSDVSDYTLLKKIADTFYRRSDLNKALEYNERGLARNPSDYNWSLALAVINKQLGNSVIAQSYLEAAIKLAPEETWLIKLRSEY